MHEDHIGKLTQMEFITDGILWLHFEQMLEL